MPGVRVRVVADEDVVGRVVDVRDRAEPHRPEGVVDGERLRGVEGSQVEATVGRQVDADGAVQHDRGRGQAEAGEGPARRGKAPSRGHQQRHGAPVELGHRRQHRVGEVVVGVPEGAVEVGDHELDVRHRGSLRVGGACGQGGSEHAGVDARGQRTCLLPSVAQVGVGQRARHDEGREHLPPAQPGEDAGDVADGAGAVVPALRDEEVGHARASVRDLFEPRVDALQEVLHEAGHHPEVLRGDEDGGGGGLDVVRAGVGGGQRADPAGCRGVSEAGQHRSPEGVDRRRHGVPDDEQVPGHAPTVRDRRRSTRAWGASTSRARNEVLSR